MDEKREKRKSNNEGPCPICGQQDFIWGDLVAEALHFVAWDAERGLLDQLADNLKATLTARRCTNCDNLQVFHRD